MKKILSILTLLVAFAVQGVANRTIYLSPGVWNVDGARFAVWAWPNTGEGQWVDALLAPNETNIYQVTLPDDIANIIWVRMNGATTENNWDNKWNQTDDIVLGNENLYTITGWGGDKSPYSAGTYSLATISTVQLQGNFATTGSDWNAIDLSAVAGEENTWSGTLDLTDFTDDKEFKLVINGGDDGSKTYAGWIGTNTMTVYAPSGWVLAKGESDNANCMLYNSTTGYKTYKITASWEPNSNYAANWTLKIEGIDERLEDAEISSVVLKHEKDGWGDGLTLTAVPGETNVYSGVLDLSTVNTDFSMKLVVNGDSWVSSENIILATGSVPVDLNGTNYVLANKTSGYQTYTITATWTPNPNAAQQWTLNVEGKDARIMTFYLVGDFTGGWPPTEGDDGSKDVEMTKQANGLYTYEVASFAAEAQKYEYKLRANKVWGMFDLPNDGNNDYTFTEAGNYKLTFTANVTGEKIDGIAGYTLTLNAERLPDPVVLPGTAIWENTTGVTPDWSGPFAEIASDKFADVNVGDIIHVAVQNVTAGERWSAQAVIFDGYGVQLEGGTPVGDGTQTVASYVVTGDMLALLKANGMRVGGNKYTTTKVSVESPVYTGSENSIWVGDLALAWTPQATVSKYHFINSKVKEGDVIKLSYESTGSPNIQILPDWGGSYGTVEYGDGFATLVVTAGNESVLMDKGLIVNADGITLKQIELLAENRVTEKNMTITDGRHILSNEFDQYPDDYKVVLSISNNNDPFVSVDGWGIGKGFYLDNWESATTDKMLDIAGKGGKTFEVIITVGDLKETAKNGGDSYIGNSNYPQGGVTFNIWSGCKLESAKVLIPVYYFITGENDAWTVGDEITAAEGVYSATAKGAGKLFAIARASSLNTAGDDVTDWKTIVRPVTTDGNFIVNFANYSDNTMSGEGKVWQIGATNDADVTINYTPADGKFAISCQTEVKIGELGYSTYSNSQKYAVSGDGISANFISVSGDVATLNEVAAGAVLPGMAVTNKAGKNGGIILKGTAGAKATISSVALDAEVVTGVADNLMAGSGDYEYQLGTQFADGDEYIAYILYKNDAGEAAFMKWDGSDEPLAAHKAFLAVPKTNAAPQFIIFGGGEGTTGIEAVTPSQRTGQYYTLDGRRVENPTKGLYIINGKKVVIK